MPTLANNTASQMYAQCILNVKGNETCYKGLADWRWPWYLASAYIPMIFALLEFCMNRIEVPPRLVTLNIGVYLGYLLITFCGQELFSQPIYPSVLDW